MNQQRYSLRPCGTECSDDCYSVFQADRLNEDQEQYCIAAHVTFNQASEEIDRLTHVHVDSSEQSTVKVE